jgi:hypothetical protein
MKRIASCILLLLSIAFCNALDSRNTDEVTQPSSSTIEDVATTNSKNTIVEFVKSSYEVITYSKYSDSEECALEVQKTFNCTEEACADLVPGELPFYLF